MQKGLFSWLLCRERERAVCLAVNIIISTPFQREREREAFAAFEVLCVAAFDLRLTLLQAAEQKEDQLRHLSLALATPFTIINLISVHDATHLLHRNVAPSRPLYLSVNLYFY